MTIAATLWAGIPRRRSCRRCSRWPKPAAPTDAISSPLISRVGRRKPVSRAASISIITRKAGIRPPRIGVFGATAACAKLLGLSVEQTARALALAATFSSGLKANFGTMTKPLHVGQAARNGLYAALLASEDFTASTDAIEHRQGFLRVFNGEGNFTIDPIIAEWGSPWDIVDPGLAIKQYPCCGSTHPAVDAMLMLVRENDLTPAMVTPHQIANPSATFRAYQPARSARCVGCQVQRAVLPRARIGQRSGADRTFRGRQLR